MDGDGSGHFQGESKVVTPSTTEPSIFYALVSLD